MAWQIIGIDEVGRGAWAGPLTLGVVGTPETYPPWWEELDDSKKVNERKREHIYDEIVNTRNIPWAVTHIWPEDLDKLGLTIATKLAIEDGLDLLGRGREREAIVIIDGADDFGGLGIPIVQADRRIKEVSAASIVAKVSRDRIMRTLPDPGYGYAQHKGYGTDKHVQALEKLGPSVFHRWLVKPIRERYISREHYMRAPLVVEFGGNSSTREA